MIATGLHSDWCDQAPAIQGTQSTSQACADVKADLPPADADHDDNNNVSNHLPVTNICIFHLLEDTLDGQAR